MVCGLANLQWYTHSLFNSWVLIIWISCKRMQTSCDCFSKNWKAKSRRENSKMWVIWIQRLREKKWQKCRSIFDASCNDNPIPFHNPRFAISPLSPSSLNLYTTSPPLLCCSVQSNLPLAMAGNYENLVDEGAGD